MISQIREASAEITQSVASGVDCVHGAVKQANTAREAMQEMAEGASVAAAQIVEMNDSLIEQRSATLDIAVRIESMARETEKNSRSSEQVAKVGTDIHTIAVALNSDASFFKLAGNSGAEVNDAVRLF